MESNGFALLDTPPHVALANFYPFARNEVAGPHWSESNLFLPATNGRGVVRVGPQRFDLKQGQLLHVPWAAPIQYVADARDPFVLIGVHLQYIPWSSMAARPLHTSRNVDLSRGTMQAAPVAQPFSDPFLIDPPPHSPLVELAVAIARAYEPARIVARARSRAEEKQLKLEREAQLRALAIQFLLEVISLRRGAASASLHPQARIVREMVSWLDLSYRRSIRRREMAERAGISESSLAAAFRAVTGKGPIDYLIDLRLSHARALLSSSRQRVSEIAERVGIPDVYYFSKLFKRRVGMGPLQYRKQRQI